MKWFTVFVALGLAASAVQPSFAAGDARELDRTYLRLFLQSQAMLHWADCRVQRSPAAARQLFDPGGGSPERQQARKEFFTDLGGTCLYGASYLQLSGVLATGAVAQQLIALEKTPLPVRPPIADSVVGGGTYSWTWQALTPESQEMSLPIASCVLQNHGNEVADLLSVRAVSESERVQFNKMRESLSACIPQGQKRLFNPFVMRAAMATVYYTAARSGSRPGPFGAAQ